VRTKLARPTIIVVLALASGLGGVVPASGQASRVGTTFYVQPADVTQPTMRYADLAFDTQNNVYLAVWGMFPVKGRFLSADGTPLGAAFWVPETSRSLIPRVAYSPDANAFLVTCLDDTEALKIEGQSGRVLGRLVRYGAAGTPQFVTREFVVSQNGLGKIPEKPPVVAYSSVSREFLVAWTDKNGYVPGSLAFNTDINARRVQLVPSGGDYTVQLNPEGEIPIAVLTDAEELPAIAYNPSRNQFMVVYMRETSFYNLTTQIVNAGSNTLGARDTIHTSARDNYPEIAYIAAANVFQVIWWHGATGPLPDSPDVWGRQVSADGVALGAGATIIAGSEGFEGGPGLGVSYNPHAQTSLAVFQSPFEPELGGVEIASSGVPTQPGFQVTNFRTDLGLSTARLAVEPRVAANLNDLTTRQWITINGVDYAQIVGQRIVAGSGGGTALTPPPSGLTAIGVSGSQINLSWTAGALDTSEYLIERSQNPSIGWSQIGTSTGTTYNDTAATCGTTFYYRVRGRRTSDMAYSAYSNTASGATSACPPMPIEINPNAPAPWFFAEGVTTQTGYAFETCFQVVNPNDVGVSVRFYFSAESGTTFRQTLAMAANSKRLVCLGRPEDVGVTLPSGPYGTVVQSLTAGQQVYVSRQVFWGDNWEGSTAEAGSRALSRAWYFAEGSRNSNFFENYFTVFNPTSTPGSVTLSFFREDGQTVQRTLGIGPQTRVTFPANDVAELANTSFSTTITSTVDVVAERAMYWGPSWMGGHCSIGVTSSSPTWFFAEGAVAPGFDTYYLLFNPTNDEVKASIIYYGETGVITSGLYSVPAHSRRTLPLRNEVGQINPVSTSISTVGGQGIIAERSIYWGNGGFPNWVDGTNSLGSNATAPVWYLPEGDISSGFETYVLINNPNVTPVDVTLTVYSRQEGVARFESWLSVPANARATVRMNDWLAGSNAARVNVASSFQSFSAKVAATNGTAPLSVEEAIYWRPDGVNYWRAGAAMPGIRQ
jgi:hypothetical protein